MNSHDFGGVMPVVILVIFIISAIRGQLKRAGRRTAIDEAAARVPVARPQPQPQAQQPLMRRRLAPQQPARAIVPPVLPGTARVSITPSMAETLPAEAAAAFPELDLSLPGTESAPAAARRRRMRSFGRGPAIGSPAWAANAIVASEILGPPVSLRSGATLGAPHAF